MSKIVIANIILRFLTQNSAQRRVIKKQPILCVFFLFETNSLVLLHIIYSFYYRIINQLYDLIIACWNNHEERSHF